MNKQNLSTCMKMSLCHAPTLLRFVSLTFWNTAPLCIWSILRKKIKNVLCVMWRSFHVANFMWSSLQNITYWKRKGKPGHGETVLSNGSLFINNVTEVNSGHFICVRDEDDGIIYSVHLVVGGKVCCSCNHFEG